ncbi:SAM-dependent methyltransferase [Tabrizicola sp.]|jgi:SAM-dependent MidA family methyltransferase|uniref:class I SAM-dependent methyltransferase n=1 Tax=Tabrizicola sp. TaxID=2005166 RepID=UPI001A45DC69|nr:SAM-dependent methyltransferase [Tabrizicola sp.]MBL9062339.1 SAM-dependent methyltransferase [Tabrizicola sp.]
MTPLARLLAERIRETGPITVADYMAECLLHPVHGYYTTRDPFGTAGDFTTAPEISQMFGELLGLALAQSWLDRGSPTPFTLAELGPGRGTLMADILRATRGVPGFHAAAQVVLVEASPVLRQKQQKTICRGDDLGLRWIEAAGDLPEQPLFLVANEFFDALPIHQYQYVKGGWHERLIGLQDGALAFGLAEGPTLPGTMAMHQREEGMVIEENRIGRFMMRQVHHRLYHHGGVALVIDYGDWRSRGDTLQALRRHAFDDPLAHPGEADLTAHVDFEPLAENQHHFYTTQGTFLTRLGIDARAERLAQSMTGERLESHRAAHRRLTDPSEMGSLFKVLAVTSAGAPPPPGFA